MTLSVVIPAYNAEKYIAETIESVLAQTLRPDEIIVVDDGSTDGTVAVLQSFGARIRVLHTPNQRAAAARNVGVQHSTGHWIAFLDADDLWLPTKLERQMERLAADSTADVCYCSARHLLDDGHTAVLGPDAPAPPTSAIRRELLRRTSFNPSAAIVRRRNFLAVGGFDPDRRWAQDWDLWLRLYPTTRFIHCPELLLLYRTHPHNMSANVMGSLNSAKEVYQTYALPMVHPAVRWFHRRRFLAHYEYGSACMLRDRKDPQALPLLLTALARQPFYMPRRYKTLLLMLGDRTRRIWGNIFGGRLSVERS